MKLSTKISLWLILFSAYDAYLLKLYSLSFFQMMIFITSLIYHNNLIKNFRIIDIIIVQIGLFFHIYSFTKESKKNGMCMLMYGFGIYSYLLSRILNEEEYHCGVHIFPVIGNLLLHRMIINNKIKS
jgi:hypothetical protein